MRLMMILFTPMISYFILVFVIATIESFGGRGAAGNSAIEEYICILVMVTLLNCYLIMKGKL